MLFFYFVNFYCKIVKNMIESLYRDRYFSGTGKHFLFRVTSKNHSTSDAQSDCTEISQAYCSMSRDSCAV